MKIETLTTNHYSLGLDLSLDTHTDDVLVVFQNGPNCCLCLRNVNKHENRKTNNIFLLPIRYPY
jgi:hypothetical protein